ncbi:MAG: hypothetical protein KAU20_03540 [Nanoarchaeota archaeon]|nr:hypothetical protein [Nanoarchaeota archaeon]
MPYVTFLQGYDSKTSAPNIQLFGEVYEVAGELFEGRASKSFCDGQTSITTPRYADDNMITLFFQDEAMAVLASELIRQEYMDSVLAGTISPSVLPYWIDDTINMDLMLLAIAVSLTEEVRNAFSTAEVTDAQLNAAAEAYLLDHGEVPTEEELLLWIEENRSWQRI